MKASIKSILIFFIAFVVTEGSADPGDTLFVQGTTVNVRTKPDANASIVMRLNRGHKLIEFGRKGEWINVGIERTGGKDGWILSSLVTSKFSGNQRSTVINPNFEKFRKAVEALDDSVYRKAGVRFFTRSEYLGDGIVQVTATDTWVNAPASDRQGNLRTLFELWDAAEGSGLPIMVRVVDGSGKLVTQKSRR